MRNKQKLSEKLKVMFLQSQDYPGSDTYIHLLMMQYLNRERVEVHAAVNPGAHGKPSKPLTAISEVPDLHIRKTNYGVTVNESTKGQIVYDLVFNSIPSLISLAGLVSYVRKNNIAVLHGTEKPRDAFYGWILARLSGAKLIIHMHVKIEKWISPLTRFAMRHADGLVGVSNFVRQSAIDFGYDARKTYAVLNAIDAHKWDDTMDGSAIRREFHISPQTPVLSIISRLYVWKGHRELLQALAIVKKANPNFRLLIVGKDDPRIRYGGGSFTDHLKEMVKELNLGEQVIFTGFRSDIPQLLAATDIFSMPTFEEPCAVAFLEAMAMKKPIIALDSGGTPEIIQHNANCLLSPPGDIEALASNILTLLNNPALRQEMGECGRMRVEKYFNPQRLADDMEAVYRKVLSAP